MAYTGKRFGDGAVARWVPERRQLGMPATLLASDDPVQRRGCQPHCHGTSDRTDSLT